MRKVQHKQNKNDNFEVSGKASRNRGAAMVLLPSAFATVSLCPAGARYWEHLMRQGSWLRGVVFLPRNTKKEKASFQCVIFRNSTCKDLFQQKRLERFYCHSTHWCCLCRIDSDVLPMGPGFPGTKCKARREARFTQGFVPCRRKRVYSVQVVQKAKRGPGC